MARSSMQKKKILLIMRELLEKSDETHPLSITELILMLSENGISAERKSIYHDIEVLKEFGIDIENRREKPAGYYVASRDFELPELKLLVDAVQCARFITKKKSKELIRKLESLTSKSEAVQLQRQWRRRDCPAASPVMRTQRVCSLPYGAAHNFIFSCWM